MPVPPREAANATSSQASTSSQSSTSAETSNPPPLSVIEQPIASAKQIDAEFVKRIAVRVEQVRGIDVGCGVIVARSSSDSPRTLDVLTADHVLGGETASRNLESYVVVCWELVDGKLVRRVYRTADVVLRDPVRDLALLRVRTDKVVDANIDRLIDNPTRSTDQAVADLGPEDQSKNAKRPKNMQAWSVRVTRDVPCKLDRVQVVENLQAKRSLGDEPVSYWRLDKSIEPGMSGGPLLDVSGRVIGIASGVGAGAAYYVDWEEMRTFLRAAK